MKERVSFTEQIRIALSKPLWYKSLFQQSVGQHIGYFLILTLLITAIQCIIPMVAYIQSAGGVQYMVYEGLPSFSMENGELSVDSVIDIERAGIRLIIDTSREQFSSSDAASVAAGMDDSMPIVYLVSRTNIACNTVQTTLDLSSINWEYNNDTLYRDVPLLLTGYVVLFVLWIVVGYIVSALFFTLFGVLMSKALRLNLKFRQIFLIALYAKSVEIILEAVLEVLGISILYYIGTIIGIFITCNYMTRGMSSLVLKSPKSKDEDNNHSTDFTI